MAIEQSASAQQTHRQSGLEALLAVRPCWRDIAPAARLIALDGRWLLHAGPPLADARRPPLPLLASAVLACLYEGWAQDQGRAEALIRNGAVRLVPAQAECCVTPLAAVVSPSTSLIVVADSACDGRAAFAPLTTVGGPDLRFGTRDMNILDRLRMRDGMLADTLRAALAEPIDLLPLARAALARGDDLHNRTAAATQALVTCLSERYAHAGGEWQQRSAETLRQLAATPLFFLTVWMAAAKLMLSAAEHADPGTLITRMAGNGEVFGLSLAARPDAWTTIAASAPRGNTLDPGNGNRLALAAIGDSAVIDALGFGGQALHLAPEPRAALADYLPAALGRAASPSLLATHPELAQPELRVGLDAARIVATGNAPLVTLAMVDAAAEKGLLGRGVYLPPLELFSNALNGVS